jgi:hypothetical protein
MAKLESDEFGKQEDVSGSGKCCPTCDRSGPTQGPTEMMRSVDPIAMMSKLQALAGGRKKTLAKGLWATPKGTPLPIRRQRKRLAKVSCVRSSAIVGSLTLLLI